ncbi:unnamed protein product, partial [Rotaria sordida]
ELVLLDQLYILYKKFITFDTTFRATLWSEVDLNQSKNEPNQLWTEFCDLPSKLQYYIQQGYLVILYFFNFICSSLYKC